MGIGRHESSRMNVICYPNTKLRFKVVRDVETDQPENIEEVMNFGWGSADVNKAK